MGHEWSKEEKDIQVIARAHKTIISKFRHNVQLTDFSR